MNYDYEQTDFSKAVLAGLFAGILATLVNLAYDYVYRDISGFGLSEIINVASIILVSTLLLTIAGLIFYFLQHNIKGGDKIYIIIFLALTAFCIYGALHVQRSPDPVISDEFRKLLLGIVIISGGLASLFIPYLYKHEKIFS